MKLNIIPGLVLLFNITFGQNQQITRLDDSRISHTEVDNTVKRLMDLANVQGLSLAILNKNKPTYIKTYGFKNKEKNEFIRTSTVLYAASFSKAVFGYLTMKLVQEKTIDLDKPIMYRYLNKPIPEYEYFSDLKSDNRWKSITARMCLSHTTGLPNVRWFHPTTGKQTFGCDENIFFTWKKIRIFWRRHQTFTISN